MSVERCWRCDAGERCEQHREKNAAAVALGRLGGARGGKARAAALSPGDRTLIAQQAAHRRWHEGAYADCESCDDNVLVSVQRAKRNGLPDARSGKA